MSQSIKIPQFSPFFDQDEIEAINECFQDNWITEGGKSAIFTEKLCEFIGTKYGVLAPNGTLSLYMALRVLDIGIGDEVILPNFTFIGTATAVEMCGATPIFCDIKENLDIDLVKAKKLLSKKTKVIMPVHLYGLCSNMDEVLHFAREFNLRVIEDAAQAIGVNWDGKNAGSFGDIGSFSFFADKTITTGEGGFLATNSEEIYEKLLYFRNQGRLNRGSFFHPKIGYNFRITDFQAAIGIVQLSKVLKIIQAKESILRRYQENLNDIVEILVPAKESKSNHVPFRVCILVKGGSSELMNYLTNCGIEPRTFFRPLHSQPAFEKIMSKRKMSKLQKINENYPISNRMFNEGICLPSYAGISESQIDYICEKIKQYVQ